MSKISKSKEEPDSPEYVNLEFAGNRIRVNLNAKLDLTDWFAEYDLLTKTDDQAILDKAVYDDTNPNNQDSVSKNPNLSAEHCRYLIHKIDGDGVLREDLVLHTNFPEDKLLELARNEKCDRMLKILSKHHRASAETRVTAVLRIGSHPNHY